ncbi:hypothetical protein ACF0H5_014363 [Mactra antiquata]
MFNSLNVCLLVALATSAFGYQRCCVSKRFYGEIHTTKGVEVAGTTRAVASMNKMFLEFDADMQIEFVKGDYYEDENKTTVHYETWNDFANMRSFTINNGSNTCTMEKIENEIEPYCVPNELNFDGLAYFGSGNETVHIQSWSGLMPSGLYYSLQVATNDCTPVSSTTTGIDKEGNYIVEQSHFYNWKQYDHTGPNFFNIPAQCLALVNHGKM